MAERLSDQAFDRLDLPISRYDIADYLGLSVETVSRSLTSLENRGVIARFGPRSVRIVDRDALEEGSACNAYPKQLGGSRGSDNLPTDSSGAASAKHSIRGAIKPSLVRHIEDSSGCFGSAKSALHKKYGELTDVNAPRVILSNSQQAYSTVASLSCR
jgi:hypothetical protein